MAKDISNRSLNELNSPKGSDPDPQVIALINTSQKHVVSAPGESIEVAMQALDLSTRIKSECSRAFALKNLSDIYFALKEFNRSLEYRLQASVTFEECGMTEDYILILNGIGNIYRKWNRFDKALEYYKRALKASKEISRDDLTAFSLNSIGIIYDNSHAYDKALNFYNKALKIRESLKDGEGSAGILDNIGIVYDKQGLYETALEFYQRSLEMNEAAENQKGIAASLINIGITFYNLKKFDTALDYIEKSLRISERLDDKEGAIYALFNIANIYKFNNKFDRALNFSRKALDTAKDINSKRVIMDIYKLMHEIYEAKEDYKNAYKYNTLYSDTKEIVYTEENNIRISELLSRFEIEKKEKEIDLLRKEKELQEHKFNYIEETKRILVEKNKQIEHQNNELKELNATKDKFFSIIAHDLKNPFSSLINLSEMLLKEYKEMSDEEKIMWLKDIEHSSKNSFHLLENLLKWAMAQTDRLKFEPKKLEMNVIAADTIDLLELVAKKKKIQLVSEIDTGIYVKADEEMLKTVMRNLVTNSIKFTNEKGTVKISALNNNNNNNEIVVTVSDTGIGISKDNLKKLFRIDTNYKMPGTKKETGSGLGLVLCKEFIEKNSGKIWAESSPGKGSHFKFTLPAGHI